MVPVITCINTPVPEPLRGHSTHTGYGVRQIAYVSRMIALDAHIVRTAQLDVAFGVLQQMHWVAWQQDLRGALYGMNVANRVYWKQL